MNYDVMALVMRKAFGSPTRKQVIISMASHINEIADTRVWPSASRLGARCEINERTVRRVWGELEELGVIHRVGEKRYMGGQIIVWNVDLRAIQRLANVLPSLEDELSQPADNLSGGKVQPPDIDDTTPGLSVQNPRAQSPTNSPLEESKEESTTSDFKKLADQFWKAAPEASRKRSSKALTLKAVRKATKQVDGSRLLDAWQSFLASPDASKDGGKFVAGIHTWLNDSKFDGWLGAEPDLLSKSGELPDVPSDLAHAFSVLADYGQWLGDRYGFPKDPRDPDSDYDEALYRQFNIAKREAA